MSRLAGHGALGALEGQLLHAETAGHPFLQHGDLGGGDAEQGQQDQEDQRDEQHGAAGTAGHGAEGGRHGAAHELMMRLRSATVVS